MAKTFYVPVESSGAYISKEAKKMYVPVEDNGAYVSKKVLKAYAPVNGLSKLFFQDSKPLGITITTRIYDTNKKLGPVTITTSIRNYTP